MHFKAGCLQSRGKFTVACWGVKCTTDDNECRLMIRSHRGGSQDFKLCWGYCVYDGREKNVDSEYNNSNGNASGETNRGKQIASSDEFGRKTSGAFLLGTLRSQRSCRHRDFCNSLLQVLVVGEYSYRKESNGNPCYISTL